MIRPDPAAASLSAGLTALGLVQSLAEARSPVATLSVVVGTLAVLLMRRVPQALAATAALSAAVQAPLVGEPAFASFLVLMVAAYALGRRCDALGLVAGLLVLVAGVAAVVAVDASLQVDAEAVPAIVYLGGAAGLGRLARSRDRASQAAVQAVTAAAESREREALAQERARIAREMHDVVAHSVSLLVVQAESAAAVLDRDPERSRAQLERIGASGRQALDELRRVLGLLRADGEPNTTGPQPGLGELPRLACDATAAGLTVDLQVDAELEQLPAGVQLTTYRIVQEALTNAVRHGRASHARVEIRRQEGTVVVDVADDGSGVHDGWSPGHGLHGMRERVRLYDGELKAGPCPAGGFVVAARIPGQR